jgi:hypothetical protein
LFGALLCARLLLLHFLLLVVCHAARLAQWYVSITKTL